MALEFIPYPLVFLVFIIAPFRLTCYYFHGWYWDRIRGLRPSSDYASYKGCEGCIYSGRSIDSSHRYFIVLALLIALLVHVPITAYHIIVPQERWIELFSVADIGGWLMNYGKAMSSLMMPGNVSPHMGLFNVTELLDTLLLSLYVLSCHVVRYFCGSGARTLSPLRMRLLKWQTRLNNHHGTLFWLSLLTVTVHTAAIFSINHGLI